MKYKESIRNAFIFVLLLWVIALLDFLLPLDFRKLGVNPRTLTGLIGIPCAVFLHSGFSHVASNTIPLLVLISVILAFYSSVAIPAMFFMVIFTNSLVWIIGRGDAYHIGASGLVYSLAAFLIAAGFYKKAFLSGLIALVIATLYGGLVWGIIPGVVDWYISWETHLLGAIIGVYLAHFYKKSL